MKISDIPTLVAWGNSAPELWTSEKSKWYSREGLTKWIQHRDNDILLVADDGGTLAGMCFTRYMIEWYYCDTLYIDPAYQKQGVGRKLLDETVRRVKLTGVKSIALDVNSFNAKVVGFYKKIGFEEAFHAIWMEKRL